MYYSIEQICKRLHKNERQIRYMVNQGRLTPVNPDTYRRDGGYRFSQEEIERVEQMLELPGLSVKEAAQELEITPQYLLQFVSNGELESEVKWIGQKKRRYFQKEEIKRFKKFLNEDRQTNRIGEYGRRVKLISREVRIFEECLYDGNESRVVSLEPLKIMTNRGEIIQLGDIDVESASWPEKPYIRQKGYTEFEIPIPRHPQHPVYKILYKLIEDLGDSNIQIYETSFGDYFVRCRLGSIPATNEEYKLLLKYLSNGEITYENGRVHLESNEITKTITIPKDLWQDIEQISENENESIHQTVTKALRNYLN
ncbi:helix-turn-helix domain-containing protein [Pontibacillus marinus]|uniref:Uncharacterized protein n=1 Tax=Pontibacillus marinus BH030004 = DSM 16465 TaxID=1385511 RepID=A0A0A5I6T2_9BACI|nr:helix-turn-helix domain-containing protein [Pontibacillus marinus]KGX91522.1 hypothetical protein N783_07645 [Pontibacillus marinus BH030004 = DSM 16465]